jgi:hypothetical protein
VVCNGVGLNHYSVRLLKYVDGYLYKLFKSRGYVSKSCIFRTARGHTLAVISSGGDGSPKKSTISRSRYELWKCSYGRVGESDVLHGQVVNAELGSDRSITRFAYGVSSIADLVIGADGVRSFIKWAIFNEKDANHFAPVYEYGHCSPIAARR